MILASAWLAGVVALLAWTLMTPWPVLREQLKRSQFWSLEICVAIGVVCTAIVLRQLARQTRRDLWPMIAPMAVAMAMTVAVAPRANRIFYDEQIYENIGQNLADLGLAQMCNDGAIVGGRLACFSGEYNKQPYAYPHALSLVFRIFGVGSRPAFLVNATAMVLSVSFVYLLVLTLFQDRVAAFFAGLLFALTPEQIVWSASAAAEPSASLACVAALLSAACFVRSRSTVSLVGAAVATAYAIQFRAESLLIIPAVAMLIWQRAPEEFTRPRFWWAGLLFLALSAVHVGHLAAVRNERWGTSGDRLSLSYVAANLRVNGWFYLTDPRFPLTYTLLAIFGLTGRRAETGRAAIVLYFALFFGVALLFYAGSYNYGADVRYSLATYPALAVLGGLGASHLLRKIGRGEPGLPAVAGLTLALAIQFGWYVSVVRSTSDTAVAARADVEFAESIVRDLPADSYVLTQNPGLFQVLGVNSGQTSLALRPHRLDELAAQYSGGLYMHWNFWCNVDDPVQHGFCTKLLDLRSGELVKESTDHGQRFALYRLHDLEIGP